MNIISTVSFAVLTTFTAAGINKTVDHLHQNQICEYEGTSFYEETLNTRMLHDPKNTNYFAEHLARVSLACNGPSSFVDLRHVPAKVVEASEREDIIDRARVAMDEENHS